MPQKTTGESRVRTEFNPSKNGKVDELKQKFAELINLVEDIDEPENLDPHDYGEFRRLIALSMTELESSAHWAVKAATFS